MSWELPSSVSVKGGVRGVTCLYCRNLFAPRRYQPHLRTIAHGYMLFDRVDKAEAMFHELIALNKSGVATPVYSAEDDEDPGHEPRDPLFDLVAALDGLGQIFIARNQTGDAEKVLREAVLTGKQVRVTSDDREASRE